LANFEVEIRGLITKEKYIELETLFAREGKFKYAKNRILLCYPDPNTGSLVEECKIDIRIRTTNGIPEIIIKEGEWGGENESRKELFLRGKKGEFDKMVMMLAALGHKKGIFAERRGAVYMYKGIEFSLVEVPDHSFYFEAEVMVKSKDRQKLATEKILKICAELGLKPLSQQEFYDYINRLNAESNEPFDFANYQEGYFNRRYGI